MKTVLTAILAGAIGLALGVAAADYLAWHGSGADPLRVGPWRTNVGIGSRDANMLTRAAIARTGLLALSSDESVYFLARSDSDGRRLRADRSYRISGPVPPGARWWSITAYDEELYLFPSSTSRYSVSGRGTAAEGAGRLSVTVGPDPASGSDWIETAGDGEMTLNLRLYRFPEPRSGRLASLQLPTIEAIGEAQ